MTWQSKTYIQLLLDSKLRYKMVSIVTEVEVLEGLKDVGGGDNLLLQQLEKLVCDLCQLYDLPQHPDLKKLDQPLPAAQEAGQVTSEDEENEEEDEEEDEIEEEIDDHDDLDDMYEVQEEVVDPVEKKNLAVLENSRKNQRQDHMNNAAVTRSKASNPGVFN